MRRKFFMFAPLALLAVVLFIAIGGEIVQALWNWLLPPLFGWHEVTFWQALGLLVLCRILFGGFGGGAHRRSEWRHRIRERMEQMTPEEREAMRWKWGTRGCPPGPPPTDAKA